MISDAFILLMQLPATLLNFKHNYMTDINNKQKVGIYDSMKETIREQEAERKRLLSIKPRYMSTEQVSTAMGGGAKAKRLPRKRTPLGYDTILAASKSLPLKDRVELVKELTRVNTEEVDIKQKEFEEAKSLINP